MEASHVPLGRRHNQFRHLYRGALRHEQPALHRQPHAVLSRRAGYAPAALGRLSRAGVPVAALFVSSAGIVVAAVMYTLYSTAAFTLIFSISIFGALFAWLMIFVTHLAFRRQHRPAHGDFNANANGGFRMLGAPWTTMLGAALLIAVFVTSVFTPGFRSMLLYGIPFLALLTLLYWLRAPKNRPDADLSTEE